MNQVRLSNDVSISECSCVMKTDPGKCLDLGPVTTSAVMKCQIRLRYSSPDSILNPISEAETDETMLEQH